MLVQPDTAGSPNCMFEKFCYNFESILIVLLLIFVVFDEGPQ